MAGNNKRDRPLDAIRSRPAISTFRNRPVPYNGGLAVDRADTGQHIALVEIDWDTGTEYYSFTGIRSPNAFYDDLVTSIDPINREVALIGGSLSASTATLKLYNRNRTFSKKWNNTPIRGRAVRIKLVSIPLGLASAITLFAGKITSYQLSNVEFSITATDTKFDEIFNNTVGQTIPIINGLNFPTLIAGSPAVLVPVVVGYIGPSDPLAVVHGEAVSYLVETTDSPGTAFVYITGAQPQGVFGVNTGAGVETFYTYGVLNGAGTRTTRAYNSRTYDVVTFTTEQRDGTRPNEMEITAYVNGLLDNDAVTQIFNPVRALEFILENYTTILATDFDTILESAAIALATTLGYDVNGISTPLYSPATISSLRMAITDLNLKWSDVMEKICESFGMQLYTTREGKLAVFILTADADPAPLFSVSDSTDIMSGSMVISSNPNIASVLQYQHSFRYTAGQRGDPAGAGQLFLRNPDYTIPGEKKNIGNFDSRVPVSLWYHGSEIRSVDVARCYADYYRSGAQLIEFDLPISFFRQAELNRYIGITHWQGVSSSGVYNNVTARIYGIQTIVAPTTAHLHLKCFKRTMATRVKDWFQRADSTNLGSGWTKSESTAGTIQIVSNQLRLNTPSYHANAIALRTETFGNNQLARMQFIGESTSGGPSSKTIIGGIIVRGSGAYNTLTGYVLAYDQSLSKLTLSAFVSGSGTLLATSSAAQTAIGSKYELRVSGQYTDVGGTVIQVFAYDEASLYCGNIITVNDAANIVVSGAPGIFLNGAGGAVFPWWQTWIEFDATDF